MKEHQYRTSLRWTGNNGQGTANYSAYSRNHEVSGAEKAQALPLSSDSHFRGDGSRYNPEELLVAALSSCHLLVYLHLCAVNGVVVTAYKDDASGVMVEEADGGGYLTSVVLRPHVAVAADSMVEKAMQLHHEVNHLCFIARSVNFPVSHEPVVTVERS